MFVRSIARGSNYRIRSLWINAHTYNNLNFLPFFSFFFFLFFVGEGGGGEVQEREGGVGFLWGERGLGLRWFIS